MIKFVLGLLPWWAWAALIAIALATATAWHFSETHAARNEGRAEIKAQWDALEAERDRVAAADALRRTEANIGVTNEYRKRINHAAAAASAARSELEQLRDEISRRVETATPGQGIDDAAAIGKLLGACAAEYQLVAADADRLAEQVRGLQSYANKVCMTTEETP